MLALLSLALAGCSDVDLSGRFGFTRDKNSDFSADPNEFPARYRSDIADFMRTYLENPTQVKDAFIAEPVLKPVNGQPRYVTCVRYNPRDGQNKYMGSRTNLVIFFGGHPNQFLPEDAEKCAGLNYQPYPEIQSMVP